MKKPRTLAGPCLKYRESLCGFAPSLAEKADRNSAFRPLVKVLSSSTFVLMMFAELMVSVTVMPIFHAAKAGYVRLVLPKQRRMEGQGRVVGREDSPAAGGAWSWRWGIDDEVYTRPRTLCHGGVLYMRPVIEMWALELWTSIVPFAMTFLASNCEIGDTR